MRRNNDRFNVVGYNKNGQPLDELQYEAKSAKSAIRMYMEDMGITQTFEEGAKQFLVAPADRPQERHRWLLEDWVPAKPVLKRVDFTHAIEQGNQPPD
jgi:hypothetical protein